MVGGGTASICLLTDKPEGFLCAKLRYRGSPDDAAALFSVSLPSENPLEGAAAIAVTSCIVFLFSPAIPGKKWCQEGNSRPKLLSPRKYTCLDSPQPSSVPGKHHRGHSFGKGMGEIPPAKAQIILSNTYFQLRPKQGATMVSSIAGCLRQGSQCLRPGRAVLSGTKLP